MKATIEKILKLAKFQILQREDNYEEYTNQELSVFLFLEKDSESVLCYVPIIDKVLDKEQFAMWAGVQDEDLEDSVPRHQISNEINRSTIKAIAHKVFSFTELKENRFAPYRDLLFGIMKNNLVRVTKAKKLAFPITLDGQLKDFRIMGDHFSHFLYGNNEGLHLFYPNGNTHAFLAFDEESIFIELNNQAPEDNSFLFVNPKCGLPTINKLLDLYKTHTFLLENKVEHLVSYLKFLIHYHRYFSNSDIQLDIVEDTSTIKYCLTYVSKKLNPEHVNIMNGLKKNIMDAYSTNDAFIGIYGEQQISNIKKGDKKTLHYSIPKLVPVLLLLADILIKEYKIETFHYKITNK